VTFRRPTPVLTELHFDIERSEDDGRVTSTARPSASYLFHAFGTNLQFAPGEFNFVKTRAQHGTKEAFRLRDEHFYVPEPE
jgi:hypothetical protein